MLELAHHSGSRVIAVTMSAACAVAFASIRTHAFLDFLPDLARGQPATLSLVQEFWRHRRKLLSSFLSAQAHRLGRSFITRPASAYGALCGMIRRFTRKLLKTPTSSGAAPGRTATSRASTPASAMSCSTVRFSTICASPRSSSRAGDATTPRSGPRPRSDISHQHQRCSCLHSPRGSRVGPLSADLTRRTVFTYADPCR
jgi:hypothetical protein